MSGLDQMLARIDADASKEAAEILRSARAEAADIAAAAKAERDAKAAELAEKSARDTAVARDRIAASLEQQHRTALLAAKQQIIAEMLGKAYDAVLALPDDRYFAFLRQVLAAYVQPRAGEICFSRRDLDRMPEGYLSELQAVAQEKGGSLTLSGETRAMDGGFVLLYGGIEENCTVRALFDARREALQDQVHALLFA